MHPAFHICDIERSIRALPHRACPCIENVFDVGEIGATSDHQGAVSFHFVRYSFDMDQQEALGTGCHANVEYFERGRFI